MLILVPHLLFPKLRKTLEEIQQATVEDVTLQCLVYLMRNNSWNNLDNLPKKFKEAHCAELRMFHRVKDDLTVNDQSTVILCGSRIVVPKKLRGREREREQFRFPMRDIKVWLKQSNC